MNIKIQTGSDSGMTNQEYFEDIIQTSQACNLFMVSLVKESGADITIPMKKLYGVLSGLSKPQRPFMRMLARCRKVEDQTVNVLNDQIKPMNNHHHFWTFRDEFETRNPIHHGQPFTVDGVV